MSLDCPFRQICRGPSLKAEAIPLVLESGGIDRM
jgi:hypothetical protein